MGATISVRPLPGRVPRADILRDGVRLGTIVRRGPSSVYAYAVGQDEPSHWFNTSTKAIRFLVTGERESGHLIVETRGDAAHQRNVPAPSIDDVITAARGATPTINGGSW